MGLDIRQAHFVSLFAETLAYGVFHALYWVLLLMSSRGMFSDRLTQKRFVISTATIMLILATMHVAVNFSRAFRNFITQDDTIGGDPAGYDGPPPRPLETLVNCILDMQICLGDGVLIWRCYVVCGKKRWLAVSLGLLLVITAGISGIVTWSISQVQDEASVFNSEIWNGSTFVLTLANNVICTGGIIYQIWSRCNHNSMAIPYKVIIAAVFESGAIYSSVALAIVVTYVCRSNGGLLITLNILPPTVGIVFILLILQVQLAGHWNNREPFPISLTWHASSIPHSSESHGCSTREPTEALQNFVAPVAASVPTGGSKIKYTKTGQSHIVSANSV